MTVTPNEGLTTFEIISIFSKLLPDPNHRTALMLWGLTGTGKSQIQRQILAQLSEGKPAWKAAKGVTTTGALEVIGDWGLVDLRTSLLEPTDLRGLPDLKGSTVRWVAPDELPLVGQEDRFPEQGVLFLDEMTHAQPAMQSACFSLVLDRRCGPHVLLPKWKLVSASNYERENANTYQLSGPLRSRFEHYHLRCSLEAFKEWGWGYQNNIDGDCSGPVFGLPNQPRPSGWWRSENRSPHHSLLKLEPGLLAQTDRKPRGRVPHAAELGQCELLPAELQERLPGELYLAPASARARPACSTAFWRSSTRRNST